MEMWQDKGKGIWAPRPVNCVCVKYMGETNGNKSCFSNSGCLYRFLSASTLCLLWEECSHLSNRNLFLAFRPVLYLLFLSYPQVKIIPIPKWHVLGRYLLIPFIAILSGMKWYFIVLICSFLMIWSCFLCAVWSFAYLLWENVQIVTIQIMTCFWKNVLALVRTWSGAGEESGKPLEKHLQESNWRWWCLNHTLLPIFWSSTPQILHFKCASSP